jgi:2-polyprenyl-3-methyl-5-hydroxy-6-metoxy-1,4-benzoquinol methylase
MADIGTDHDPTQWREAGGNIQSLTFYLAAMPHLATLSPFKEYMSWSIDENDWVKHYAISIHDYGCGHGDGTAVLQSAFPMATIKGFDISPEAIAEAWNRWPTIEFAVGDVTDPQEKANIIYCSHTLEHLLDPAGTIMNLRKYCNLLVVVLPTITEDMDGGHTGAMTTDEVMLAVLPDVPQHAAVGFSTLRTNVQALYGEREAVIEANNMFVLQGELTAEDL